MFSIDSHLLQTKLEKLPKINIPKCSLHFHYELINQIYNIHKKWDTQYKFQKIKQQINCTENEICSNFDFSIPSMLSAILFLYKKGQESWDRLMQTAGISENTHNLLYQFLKTKEEYENTYNMNDLNYIQSLSSSLIQFLLVNSQVVPSIYGQLWNIQPHLYGYFVPLNVQHSYEKQLNCIQTHQWETDQGHFTLKILSPEYSIDKSIMNSIQFRLYMMIALQDKTEWHCKNLLVNWIPSSRRKLLYVDDCIINRNCKTCNVKWNSYQINTGATYRKTCDTLAVWRKEEAGKTFVHEMMHSLSFDFEDELDTGKWIQQHFALEKETPVLFFESYVETWATILNIYIIGAQRAHGVVRGSEGPSQNNMNYSQLEVFLEKETQFILWQVSKILYHSGFDKFSSFFKRDHGHTLYSKWNTKFSQSTSVLSYFIIKSAHLWNINWFISTFIHPRLMSNPNRPTQLNWLRKLLDIFEDQVYQDTINLYIKTYDRLYRKSPDSFLCTTMRMTLFED